MNAPPRTVHQADALAWLAEHRPLPDASVITSLPDWSELPALSLEAWQAWFEEAAWATLSAVSDEGVAIFFQSDIRAGALWIDKGALVQRAASRLGLPLLFHKIVCRLPPGTMTRGRASYSHMLGFSRAVRPAIADQTPDVLPDAGPRPATKAMGVAACLDACRFVLRATRTRTVVDPFCGYGTVLAVANAVGLGAIGVDISARMCRKARQLVISIDKPSAPLGQRDSNS